MYPILAKQHDDAVIYIAVTVAALIFSIIGFLRLRELIAPHTVVGRVRRFLGRKRRGKLEVHEKTFPGYDLASVNRALTSYFDERCSRIDTLGSYNPDMFRELFERDIISNIYQRKTKVSSPSYQRLAVDVDEEESFVSNCLYLCRLKPGDGTDDRIAVLLSIQAGMVDYDEDMEARTSPALTAKLSVACGSRKLADAFFNELESRRRELSVYRGKVIDPVVNAGGIRSISFRRIHHVREKDLVLPDAVKSLLLGSIVNFYRNQEALRAVGVEMKRGVLFHSPPGTGKTSISLYLAGLLPNFTVCFISGRRLMYPREVCAMARYLQPAMLVFEDIDLIAQERDHNGLATVLGELMNQIDGCEPNEQVLFIMNTNSMSRIEEAVRNRPGRVDQIIHIPLPGKNEREELLRYFGREIGLHDAVVRKAAEATEGATPALLKEVVKRSAVMAVTRTQGNGSGIEVDESDVMLAIQQVQYQREHATAIGAKLSDAVL
jgi:hypothetical protein